MKRGTKKIVAREWLTFIAIGVTFPLTRLALIFVRSYQEKKSGIDLPGVTKIEIVLFLLSCYIFYLFVKSIIWSIRTLRENGANFSEL
ncbi:MAG: hypothetical protein NG737_03090 [Omnitrophica bacterium]|nr:hypothetical protein [Candidatus Omnitrophota bacterium]